MVVAEGNPERCRRWLAFWLLHYLLIEVFIDAYLGGEPQSQLATKLAIIYTLSWEDAGRAAHIMEFGVYPMLMRWKSNLLYYKHVTISLLFIASFKLMVLFIKCDRRIRPQLRAGKEKVLEGWRAFNEAHPHVFRRPQ